MPTLSAALKAQADLQNTKAGWSAKVVEMLGPSRVLRGFRDANSAATDPASTGVEFLNVGSVGEIPIVAGNIAGFGILTGTTIRQPADLSTGACVLRLEGNGHSITFTLGLVGSGKEFTRKSNFTAANNNVGIAFTPASGLLSPILLNSGTGPLAPVIDFSSDPTIIVAARLCDWTSGSRVEVGTIRFNKRDPNIVMEHAWQAREYGDIIKIRTADNGHIIWGTGGDAFRCGGDNLIAPSTANGDANMPLQEVEIRMIPDTAQRWANYPFRGGFDQSTDTLAPRAHKWELLNYLGEIRDVIELYSTRDANNTPGSGWPCNDPRMRQNWHDPDENGVYQPFRAPWTGRMGHAWKSHKPKVHSLIKHFIPGVEADVLQPENVKARASDPQQYPPITGTSIGNILGAARISPKWSRPKNGGYDTNIVDTVFELGHSDNWMSQAIGHGFEPGSMGKKTRYNPPGGSRNDRALWHDTLIRFISDPTGNRVHGNVPWRELLDHWNMNYSNDPHHFFTDVNRGLGINKAWIKGGDVCFNGTYYGGNDDARMPRETYGIYLFSVSNGQGAEAFTYDKNGRRFNPDYNRDLQHNQSSCADAGYTTVSPRAVLNSYHSFSANILANFDATRYISKMNVTGRAHAWYVGQFVKQWMMASNAPNTLSAADIEDMFAAHLKLFRDAVQPEWDAQNTIWGVGLRRYGVPLLAKSNGQGAFWLQPEDGADFPDSKAFYFAQVFVLMKQCGLYAKMRARDPISRWSIDTIMEMLNANAIGCMLDANGRFDRYGAWRPIVFDGTVAGMPASWAGLYPPNGQEDWIRRDDGAHIWKDTAIDNTNTKHFRAQWLWAMKTFFPEKNIPRLDDAIAVVNGFYAYVESMRVSNPENYWTYRFSMMGKLKAPDYLGAPQ